MPNLKETQNITEARVRFSENLDEAGVIPVTRNGEFSAVLVCLGNIDEKEARHLFDFLKRNGKAGLEAIREKSTQ